MGHRKLNKVNDKVWKFDERGNPTLKDPNRITISQKLSFPGGVVAKNS